MIAQKQRGTERSRRRGGGSYPKQRNQDLQRHVDDQSSVLHGQMEKPSPRTSVSSRYRVCNCSTYQDSTQSAALARNRVQANHLSSPIRCSNNRLEKIYYIHDTWPEQNVKLEAAIPISVKNTLPSYWDSHDGITGMWGIWLQITAFYVLPNCPVKTSLVGALSTLVEVFRC